MRQESFRQTFPTCIYPDICPYHNAAMDCPSACGEYVGSVYWGRRVRNRWPPEPFPGPVSKTPPRNTSGTSKLVRRLGQKFPLALPHTAERMAAQQDDARARKVPPPTTATPPLTPSGRVAEWD